MNDQRERAVGWLFMLGSCVVTALLIWGPATRWVRAQAWEMTPAVVYSAKLSSRRASDNLTVREVVARYEYTYGGVSYQGSKVFLPANSVFDRRDVSKLAELERLIERGGEAACYIDPDDPSKSLLDRSLRYEEHVLLLAVGGLFFAAGLVMACRSPGSAVGSRPTTIQRFGVMCMLLCFNAIPWLLIRFSAETQILYVLMAAGVGLITLLFARDWWRSRRRHLEPIDSSAIA